jgi:flavin-dependent dehydrogenase
MQWSEETGQVKPRPCQCSGFIVLKQDDDTVTNGCYNHTKHGFEGGFDVSSAAYSQRCGAVTSTADLAIVGAGPAGSAAAIWGAQRGLRVVLLDRVPFPRFRPGECLHPGLEPIFDSLGVLDEVLVHTKVRPLGRTTSVRYRSTFEPFGGAPSGNWQAIHIERAMLDAVLLARAQAAGARVLTAQSPIEAIALGTDRQAIEVDGASIRCRFLIDATGRNAWLTRAAGLKPIPLSRRLTAYYAYYEGVFPQEQRFVLLNEGWTWVAQVTPSLVNWTALALAHPQRPVQPPDVSMLRPQGRIRGADVTWLIAPQLSGATFYLVGDAACALDPAAGNGVLRALMSGIKAVHNTVAVLDGKAGRVEAAHDYHEWMSQWLKSDAHRLLSLYDSLCPSWRSPAYTTTPPSHLQPPSDVRQMFV